MIKQVTETKSPMKKGVLKHVCLALVVLLLASAVMVGAGSADDVYENGYKVVTVTTQAELNDTITQAGNSSSISSGVPTKIILNGNSFKLFEVSANGKDIIFTGGTPNTVIDMADIQTNMLNTYWSIFTFDGVTVEFKPTQDDPYQGLPHTKKVVYKDCTITGFQAMMAKEVNFTNCIFENYDDYCVCVYGNNDVLQSVAEESVNFTGCTFNTGGKAVLIYNDMPLTANVKLNNCVFYDDGTYNPNKPKAAVETGDNPNSPAQTSVFNIEINNCTTYGFEENNSDSPLWGNKDSMPASRLTVTVKHKVTWQNDDSSEIYNELVLHGETPNYNGATPTKPADDKYEYVFDGWNPTPAQIESATTYTATFKAIEFPPSNDDDSSSQGSSVWLMGPAYSIYTSHVENGGSAYFSADFPIFKVTMPDAYSGDVTITTYSEAESPADKNVYIKADIKVEPTMSFGETATIHFKLPLFLIQQNGFEAADVCLYHGNGGWTKLPTLYTVVGDIVYYESQTDSFSPFAIVFEENAATPKDAPTVPTETETQSSGFGVLAVLAGLGCVLVLRRK